MVLLSKLFNKGILVRHCFSNIICWEYCVTQTNNHKRFKILKSIYIFRHYYIYMFHFSCRCITARFWILLAFIWDQWSLFLVFFSWFFHELNKRYMFTYYKNSCSDNLLTQSCLLLPVSHLVVRYSQHSRNNVKLIDKSRKCWFLSLQKQPPTTAR